MNANEHIAAVLTGARSGVTLTPSGEVIDLAGRPVDVVTLASTNVVLSPSLNAEKVLSIARIIFGEVASVPDVCFGLYRMERTNPADPQLISIDLNVIVKDEYRETNVEFARDNNQQAIYSGAGDACISTGHAGGPARLHSTEAFLFAALMLRAGLWTPSCFHTADALEVEPQLS